MRPGSDGARRPEEVRLHLEDIEVFGFHGVGEAERRKGNRFLVSVILEGEFGEAVGGDRIEETVDYRELEREVRRASRREDHLLIESFAGAIAARLLERFPGVRRASVRVEKATPPGLGRGTRALADVVKERG